MNRVEAGVLSVAYRDEGPRDAPVAVLLHGFPYDVHAFDEVVPRLTAQGLRCVVPFLRGYGGTRFLDPATPRSGEQAALGADLLALLDALAIERAVLAGYDWGGRAACVVAALWPERVVGLVSAEPGYNIQHIATAGRPVAPEAEHRLWYQYYLHGERGKAGLHAHRHAFCQLLWRQWSPSWAFDEQTYAATAQAFDHPDFVEVVAHSYRHRFGLVAGDPAYQSIEAHLALQPTIEVPSVLLAGADDGVAPPRPDADARRGFRQVLRRQVLPGVGHNVPQEAPAAFAEAVTALFTHTGGRSAMDPISTLDDNLARIARLAEQLQHQLAPCPVSQMRLYAWIAEWTRTADGLRAADQLLPKLPEALCDDYLAWVHGGAH